MEQMTKAGKAHVVRKSKGVVGKEGKEEGGGGAQRTKTTTESRGLREKARNFIQQAICAWAPVFLSLKAPAQRERKTYQTQRNQGEQMEFTGPFCFIPKEAQFVCIPRCSKQSLTPLAGKTQGSFYLVNTHKTVQHLYDEDYCKEQSPYVAIPLGRGPFGETQTQHKKTLRTGGQRKRQRPSL